MTEEEAKNAKHQQYVEEEKQRRSRITEGLKTLGKGALIVVATIGAYLIGRKAGKSPNEKA